MALQDFGEKIGGARKDLRGTLHRDDLATLTHIERTKLVRKDMVWPTPDYVDLVEAKGFTKKAAAAVKMVRDAFPAAPVVRADVSEANYVKACQLYVDTLNAAKAAAMASRTPQELAARLVRDAAISENIATFVEVIPGQFLATASEAFKAWRSGPMQLSLTDARGVMSALSHAASATVDYSTERMLRNNPDWPKGTSQVETYLRKERAKMIALPDGSGFALSIGGRIVRSEHHDYYARRTHFGPLLGKTFQTQEEADSALEKAVESGYQAKRTRTREKLNALLGKDAAPAETYRVGPEWRMGRPATGDDFLQDFTVRGGEFGLWVNEQERQQVLDRGHDAFCDLASAIGFSNDQLSVNQSLAIAFGARGIGGSNAAAAHYEPGRRVINLTKPHGEGCLAHEWAHFLDHTLGERADSLGLKIRAVSGVRMLSGAQFSTDDIANVAPENQPEAKRIVELNQAMQLIWGQTVTATPEELLAKYEASIERSLKELNEYLPQALTRCRHILEYNAVSESKRADKLAAAENILKTLMTRDTAVSYHLKLPEVMQELRTILGRKGHLSGMQSDLERLCGNTYYISYRMEQVRNGTAPSTIYQTKSRTEYAASCAKADRDMGKAKPYFALHEEMFARAFEASVKDTLSEKGVTSPFLVAGARSTVYPSGAERDRMKGALMPAIAAIAHDVPRIIPKGAPPVPDPVEAEAELPTAADTTFPPRGPKLAEIQQFFDLFGAETPDNSRQPAGIDI